MNDIMKNIVAEKLPNPDLLNLCLISKGYYSLLQDTLMKRKEKTRLLQFFTQYVIDLVGEEKLKAAKQVEWKDEWLGSTSYIDRIGVEELDVPISYGKDAYQRAFIFIRIVTTSESGKEKKSALVIFRRYSDSNLFVCIEPRGYSHDLMRGACSISESSFYQRLWKLFRDEFVNVKIF